ncbi:Intraflagellar transport protein 74 [Nowakowskiella sp. JEL0407]|nr:Intraflagellar transport protein 74 [Nowakowskiella sp. JEL0407]
MSSTYGRPTTGSLANRPGSSRAWGRGAAVGTTSGGQNAPPRTCEVQTVAVDRERRLGMDLERELNTDRPMTQQGLGGMRANVQGPGRVVQDKTFFQSELRQRITLLNSEITRINSEAQTIEKENSNYMVFEKRADNLANELRELQGQLGDLNLLVDKLHTDTELEDMESYFNQLKLKNQRESVVLDEIFSQRQQIENIIKDIENQIEEERRLGERNIGQLDPERKKNYFSMKDQNAKFLIEISKLQSELDEINRNTSALQEDLNQDPIKQKAFNLHEKLIELRQKKKELDESLKSIESGNINQEKNKLLEQVKEDNAESAGMDRKVLELEEQATRLKEQISQLDIELDSQNGEKNAKYEELLKRDKEMQAFIEQFDQKKKESLDKSRSTEKAIVDLLDKIRIISLKYDSATMPTLDAFKELKGDLKFKEKELKNSESTMDTLLVERERRTQDLEKVNQLETKLQVELKQLKEKELKLKEDMLKVSDIEKVKKDTEALKKKNAEDREKLRKQRDALRTHVQELAARHEAKKSALQENETYTQLGTLEQRLKHHESNNFHLKDYISAKNAESDYKPTSIRVFKMADEINSQLIKIMSLPVAR